MLPWLRIRVKLPADATRRCRGSFGPRCESSTWCWAWTIWVRAMGGGPRTYPGGVTKWQWKRMLVKRREERERYRLAREKSVYEMRQRAEVLAAHPELQQPWEKLCIFPRPGITAGQQVAGLVQRFNKPSQAEDLWTQRDGPQLEPNPSSLDTENASAESVRGQAQHLSSHPDAATKWATIYVETETQRPAMRPRPYSERWRTMDPSTSRRRKDVFSIGKNMQDYLDSFDTDPLGVAVEIETSRSKKEVHRDPLGLSVDKNETAQKKVGKKKKIGKGGRKNRGR